MLKTSTKISLKFTIFTVVILSIFGVIINAIFFMSWFNKVNIDLENRIKTIEKKHNMMETLMGQKFSRSFIFHKWSKEAESIKNNLVFKNIAKIDKYYIIYIEAKNDIFVMNITQNMEGQESLLKLMIQLTIIFSIISYLISLLFIKTSLKKLNKLVEHTKKINIDKLDKINMEGAEGDEIKIVADSLDNALSKISEQTNALKDFVSNVSHEFKTPLMIINSDIDYAIKSKEYKQGLLNIKETTKHLNNLIEHLNFITRLEDSWPLKLQKENCSVIIKETIKQLEKNYKEKEISLSTEIEDNIFWEINKTSFEMIIKNLIENAFKYTPNKWTIHISLTKNSFSVKDNGIWIKSENLEKIWNRFWKEDDSRTEEKSYGLGLYLVKKLVLKHKWTILVKTEKEIGSLFTIKTN